MLKQKPGFNISKAEAIDLLKNNILQKDSFSHNNIIQVLSISFFVYRVNFVESKNTEKLFSYFSDNSFMKLILLQSSTTMVVNVNSFSSFLENNLNLSIMKL
jgi:hypothetical protein